MHNLEEQEEVVESDEGKKRPSRTSGTDSSLNDEYYMRNTTEKRKIWSVLLNNVWKCMTSDPLFKQQMAKRAHFKG